MERFETFSQLISRINKNIRRLKRDEMAKSNLRSAHLQYLYTLYKEGALSLKQLSEMCVADKAAVSRTVDELLTLGYVRESKRGRYKHTFSLTERGEEVAASLTKRVGAVLREIGTEINEEQRIEFYSMLTKISDVLQKIADTIE